MPAYYKKTKNENNILPETLPDFWAKKQDRVKGIFLLGLVPDRA